MNLNTNIIQSKNKKLICFKLNVKKIKPDENSLKKIAKKKKKNFLSKRYKYQGQKIYK